MLCTKQKKMAVIGWKLTLRLNVGNLDSPDRLGPSLKTYLAYMR